MKPPRWRHCFQQLLAAIPFGSHPFWAFRFSRVKAVALAGASTVARARGPASVSVGGFCWQASDIWRQEDAGYGERVNSRRQSHWQLEFLARTRPEEASASVASEAAGVARP